MVFNWLFNDDEKNREKERMRILELRVKRLEELQKNPNSNYVPDVRGIRWNYHHIDTDGNIIEKR